MTSAEGVSTRTKSSVTHICWLAALFAAVVLSCHCVTADRGRKEPGAKTDKAKQADHARTAIAAKKQSARLSVVILPIDGQPRLCRDVRAAISGSLDAMGYHVTPLGPKSACCSTAGYAAAVAAELGADQVVLCEPTPKPGKHGGSSASKDRRSAGADLKRGSIGRLGLRRGGGEQRSSIRNYSVKTGEVTRVYYHMRGGTPAAMKTQIKEMVRQRLLSRLHGRKRARIAILPPLRGDRNSIFRLLREMLGAQKNIELVPLDVTLKAASKHRTMTCCAHRRCAVALAEVVRARYAVTGTVKRRDQKSVDLSLGFYDMQLNSGAKIGGNFAMEHLNHDLDSHLRGILGYSPRARDPRLADLRSRIRAAVPKTWTVVVEGGMSGSEEYLSLSKRVKLPECGPGVGSLDTGAMGSLGFRLVLGKSLSTAQATRLGARRDAIKRRLDELGPGVDRFLERFAFGRLRYRPRTATQRGMFQQYLRHIRTLDSIPNFQLKDGTTVTLRDISTTGVCSVAQNDIKEWGRVRKTIPSFMSPLGRAAGFVCRGDPNMVGPYHLKCSRTVQSF